MIEIPLSKYGKYAGQYVAIVDDIDKPLIEVNWSVSGNRKYAVRQYNNEQQLMHRFVFARILTRFLKPYEYVDHVNGDGLDNRRENLRICTMAQNQQNKRMMSNNSTGLKGVSYHRRDNRYVTSITVRGVYHYIGAFKTAEEAHAAYCEAAKKYHGEFARFG